MASMSGFSDRAAAGRALATALAEAGGFSDPVVLALPRGGVPVAYEIARRLVAPLDLVMVRKIGVPFQPELAAGAVVDGAAPEVVVNEDVVRDSGMSKEDFARVERAELAELERRRRVYFLDREPVAIEGRDVIVVDDGVATGATTRVALRALRRRGPRSLTLAVPVAPVDTLATLRSEVDRLFCLASPEPFYAIGMHYADFAQVSDGEVIRLLEAAGAAWRQSGSSAAEPDAEA